MLYKFNNFYLKEAKSSKLKIKTDADKLMEFAEDSIQALASDTKLCKSNSISYDYGLFWQDAKAKNSPIRGHYTIKNAPVRGDDFSQKRYLTISIDFSFDNDEELIKIFLSEIELVRHRLDLAGCLTRMKNSLNGDKSVKHYTLKMTCRKNDITNL